MPIVSETYRHVVGIDTHARTHTLAMIEAATGKTLRVQEFATTPAGLERAVAWAKRLAGPDPLLAAIECTSTYGAGITTVFQQAGIRVVQALPPKRATRRTKGKSDQIDAEAAATTVIGKDLDKLPAPRDTDGHNAAITVLLSARDRINHQRCQNISALTAMARSHPCLRIDARKPLTRTQITTIATSPANPTDTNPQHIIHNQARSLAQSIIQADHDLATNKTQLKTLVKAQAPTLLEHPGVGPICAATILAARSTPGRIKSEAAFAALAGTSPIPASSGNTTRHRLNRGGDRRLNQTLDTIARTRMRTDPTTKKYVEKRTTQGNTKREIRRILRRYIARQLHRHLTQHGH